MKKILAGVLASASLLTMTTSAFAATKEVKAAGDVEYDVAATTPKVVLNLIMPAKMSASLNPYGADIKMVEAIPADDDGNGAVDAVTTTAGIASPAYEIVNMSTDYGIVIDATATTTVSSAKGDTWAVATKTPDAGKKGAQMALITAADVDALKTLAESAALEDETEGVLLLDSTKTVKAKKFISIGGASSTTNADGDEEVTGVSAYMGFAGKLAESSEKVDIEWTEDDAINVALVLKVVAGPKGPVTPPVVTPTGPVFASASDVTFTTQNGAANPVDDDTGADFVFDPAKTTYNLTSDMDDSGGRLVLNLGTVTDVTITAAATGVLTYTAGNGRITASGTGTGVLTIELEDDNTGDTTTYTFNFTVT